MSLHLKQSEKCLLEILKAGLWGTAPDLTGKSVDLQEVVRLARRQSVLGVVAKTILSDKGLVSGLPDNLRLKLKSFVVSNVIASNHLDEVLCRLTSVLREKGIDPVLLKGKGLAVHYPYPELRQCGDIDVYVCPERMQEAYDVLESFADRIDDRMYVDCGRHYAVSFDDVEIEVHRHVSKHVYGKSGKRFAALADEGLKGDLPTIIAGGMSVAVPEPTFNAYYVFDHLFEHFLTSGVGLRQVSDWMLFLHRNRDVIDRERLHRMLSDMGMLKPWKMFGSVAVDYLGMDQAALPFYDSSVNGDLVLEYVMKDGNFGKDTGYYRKNSRFFLLGKLRSLEWHISRGAGMLGIFPRQEAEHFVYIVLNALQYIKTHFKLKFRKEQHHGR